MEASNNTIPLLACVWSLAMLCALAWSDPKLRRNIPVKVSPTQRRLLAALALLPGAILLLAGLAAAFLIWFGFIMLAGWGVAIALAPACRDDRP